MYVTSKTQLEDELARRRHERAKIQERLSAFLRQRYGIMDFGAIWSDLNLPQVACAQGVLARQVASVCMEDVTFSLTARKLGVAPATWSFVRDSFAKGNHDKLHRVKIPWISWSKKGNQIVEHRRICAASNEELDGRPLDCIVCSDGSLLPEYHLRLRRECGLADTVIDISAIHNRMVTEAMHKPQFVFREHDVWEVRHPITPSYSAELRDRPPAQWYYPYYLSWFLDGTYVLFETYDNPVGDVPHAKRLFESCMQDVEAATGYRPLIVQITPLSKEMLYCNEHICSRSWALDELTDAVTHTRTDDTVRLFESVAKTAIAYR